MADEIKTTDPEVMWQSWTDDGCHRTHKSFDAAERHARKIVRAGNQVEITRGFHAVARVVVDGADRVWTDVIDERYA